MSSLSQSEKDARAEGGRPSYLPQLDALRGVACLLVLIAHAGYLPDSAGVTGVGVFFALSGFLITRILLSDRRNNRNLAGFYTRRVARIFPAYYFTLFVLAICWPGRELGWCANFTFNLRYLAQSRSYFSTLNDVPPVAHFWSLCVEEHFYWVWPLVVLLMPLIVSRIAASIVVVASPVLIYLSAQLLLHSGWTFSEAQDLLSRTTVTNLTAISAGAFAAFIENWLLATSETRHQLLYRRCFVVGAFVLGFGISLLYVLDFQGSNPEFLALTQWAHHLFCAGIFLVGLSLPWLDKFSPLVYAGRISYGMYLYHLPVYAAFGLTDPNSPRSLQSACFALLTTVAVSVVSFTLMESPVIQRSRSAKSSSSAIRWSACLILVAFGAFSDGLFDLRLQFDRSDRADSAPPASTQFDLQPQNRPALPAEAISTAVLGSSHFEMGLATPYLDEFSYNFAFAGQDLYYDSLIAQQLIERLPRLRRVIFELSTYNLRHAICDPPDDWREPMYEVVWKIPPRNRPADETLSTASDDGRLSLKHRLTDESRRGWNPNYQQNFEANPATKIAARDRNYHQARFDENIKALVAAIQLCNERGIQVILVSPPLHASYREAMTTQQLEELLTTARKLCEETGCSHVNLMDSPELRDEDFYDSDHLNGLGAVKFTSLLSEKLKSIKPDAGK